MTASPGREVDANLLRGAAPGSAQARAERRMPAARISAISSRRSAGVMRSGWRGLDNDAIAEALYQREAKCSHPKT